MTLPDYYPVAQDDVGSFINRWQGAGGTERANYQLFLTELCALLGLPQPEPASEDTADNAYVFERRVDIQSADGSSSRGYIDLYKSGCFVLEAKQTGKTLDSQGWDKAMLRAQNQADQYVRALPTAEGRPPFIVVTDVGRSLELYAEFSRSGGTYVPFPDPGHHRIRLEDLRQTEIQERLHNLWHQPDRLDPSKYAARVTRDVSAKLAELARSLEQHDYDVERVAHFLKRCLFTMFSEDVSLLPEDSFTNLLEGQRENPENFPFALKALWESMNTGGYSPVLNHTIRQFNGGLFQDIDPIPLDSEQIQLLIDAAKADWRFVEPAIFGTLLERALDPRERHKLGAHFTPRTYVERLVMPTLIDPLREKWSTVRIAAEAWLQREKPDKALTELREFHHQLCQTKVLDPACGSGNFLYVALEHMKRLEGEVVNLIRDLSAGQVSFDTEGLTVDPHQFLGIELNPRAAAIAEIVLWIGYLQWHYRIHGELNIPDPVLKDFHNIECRDALLEADSREIALDENGNPITLWDGRGYKQHPVTAELIPDESARIDVYHYENPRRAIWPQADFILGNPPFIGTKRMRSALGDGYVDALRDIYRDVVPTSADLVMYWWHIAAEKVRKNESSRFGFIATKSLSQTFNRRVIEPLMGAKKPLSIIFAIPDHPWVDALDGADVRISMTVGAPGDVIGVMNILTKESNEESRETKVQFQRHVGKILADLRIGANVSGASPLIAATGIGGMGSALHGAGFILTPELAAQYRQYGDSVIRHYVGGRDLLQVCRERYIIDFSGLKREEAQAANPTAFQHVMDYVKPERDQNRRESIRTLWWRFGWERPKLRAALEGLDRYIGTTETAKHRVFQFLPISTVADHKIMCIALDSAQFLGILQSRIHILWSFATGSRHGVGNDPVYNKLSCFDAFPFPKMNHQCLSDVAKVAERIDEHRKRQQTANPGLTLTGVYNVLEKLRGGDSLTEKEKIIHQQGLVGLLMGMHDDLDRAVFEAYGWSDLAEILVQKPGGTTPLPDKTIEQSEAEEELLNRLVALNNERAIEEAQGHVHWLRPEYQASDSTQTSADFSPGKGKSAPATRAQSKLTWPKSMPDQVATVRSALATGPQTLDALATQFKRKPIKGIEQVLVALQVLGHAEFSDDLWELR